MTAVSAASMIITLDGPAASGKSSAARGVAARLGIPFVSSGLLYRAATMLVLAAAIDPADEAAVMQGLRSHQVRLEPGLRGDRVEVDGGDVTASLHTDAIDEAVSAVAGHAGVRSWVTQRLQEMPAPFVIDGRDMGTEVFPRAQHKFYLTAPAAVRARRREGERVGDLAAVTAAIHRRDQLDARQSVPAADAVHVDTGDLSLDEVVERVLAFVSDVEAV